MDGTHDFESAEKRLFRHYGVDYESHVIDIPQLGTPIRILSAGSGDPLLFVHGGLGVAAQYVPLIATLEGYRVVVPDRPGFGLSGPFSYRGRDVAEHAVTFIQGGWRRATSSARRSLRTRWAGCGLSALH